MCNHYGRHVSYSGTYDFVKVSSRICQQQWVFILSWGKSVRANFLLHSTTSSIFVGGRSKLRHRVRMLCLRNRNRTENNQWLHLNFCPANVYHYKKYNAGKKVIDIGLSNLPWSTYTCIQWSEENHRRLEKNSFWEMKDFCRKWINAINLHSFDEIEIGWNFRFLSSCSSKPRKRNCDKTTRIETPGCFGPITGPPHV